MNKITLYSSSEEMKPEVGTWVDFNCNVDSNANESFKWCFVFPNRSSVQCSPLNLFRVYVRSITTENHYSSQTVSSFQLKATEELDGTIVQCQYGEMLYSKMTLLVVNSESESENIAIEDVE